MQKKQIHGYSNNNQLFLHFIHRDVLLETVLFGMI